MSFTKFHKKNQVAYIGIQSGAANGQGIPVTDASLGTVVLTGNLAANAVFTVGVTGQTAIFTAGADGATPEQIIAGLAAGAAGTVTGGVITVTGTPFTKYKFFAGVVAGTLAIRDISGAALPAAIGDIAVVSGTTPVMTVGSYVTGAMLPTAAIALTSISATPNRQTGSVTYIGNSLSRREFTFQKDVFVDAKMETPSQVLGISTPAEVAALLAGNAIGASTYAAFEACGGYIQAVSTASSEYPNGFVQVDNTMPSETFLTCDVHLSSPDDTTYDKLWKFYDLQGSFDLSVGMGDLPLLKFNFKGNVSNPINAKVPRTVPNEGDQYVDISPSVLPDSIVRTQIVPINDTFAAPTSAGVSVAVLGGINAANNIGQLTVTGGHGVTIGDIRTIKIAGATGVSASLYNATFVAQAVSATILQFSFAAAPAAVASGTVTLALGNTAAKEFNFGKLEASNFFGFDYNRFMSGKLKGFTKSGNPTDVKVTVLQDQSGTANWDPDESVTEFFGVQLKFGTGPGYYTTILWNNLQVAQVGEGTIADFLARDVTLRNTANSTIIYS